MLIIRRVHGASMLPALRHGQLVVGYRAKQYLVDDVVIINHEGLEKIKRIVAIHDGLFDVRGDNLTASTDSRHFGLLPKESVVAKVIWPTCAR